MAARTARRRSARGTRSASGYLEAQGFRILRAHNQEVYDNLDGVLDTIVGVRRGEDRVGWRRIGGRPSSRPSPRKDGEKEMRAPPRQHRVNRVGTQWRALSHFASGCRQNGCRRQSRWLSKWPPLILTFSPFECRERGEGTSAVAPLRRITHHVHRRSVCFQGAVSGFGALRRCRGLRFRQPDRRPHVPTRPPPFFVIATTEGRGGMPGLKSGQRVEGSS